MKRKTGSEQGSGSGSTPTWKPCNTRLFLYGTLLPGGRAHSLLMDLQGDPLGPGILPCHILYHFVPGDYPLAYPGEGRVKGEVWELPLESLMILDIYEGVHQGIYERRRVTVETPQGSLETWVYRATAQALEALKDKLRRVSGDDWHAWRREATSSPGPT